MSRKGQLRKLFQLTELKIATRGEAGSKTTTHWLVELLGAYMEAHQTSKPYEESQLLLRFFGGLGVK